MAAKEKLVARLAPWVSFASINEESWNDYVTQLEALQDNDEVGLQLIEKAEQVLTSHDLLSFEQNFLSQVLQLVGLLCRQMEYRLECQRKCLHKPMNAIMEEFFKTRKGKEGIEEAEAKMVVPLLRAVANLAYDTVHIQTDLQHHAPSLAALITNGEGLMAELNQVCCGCLQNLLINPEDLRPDNESTQEQPCEPPCLITKLMDFPKLVSFLVLQLSKTGDDPQSWKSSGLTQTERNQISMFSLLSRLLDFPEGRKEVLRVNENIEFMMSLLASFAPKENRDDSEMEIGDQEKGAEDENTKQETSGGDESSPFVDEDDVITLLSLFDSILMEDEIGHEKLYKRGLMNIIVSFLLDQENEDVATTATNIVIGLSMNKNNACQLLNEHINMTERILNIMNSHLNCYVRASTCLLVGNLTFDQKSAERCNELGFLYKYIIPVFLKADLTSRDEKDAIVLKSSSLVSLKNFLVCESTRLQLAEDWPIIAQLIKLVEETPPMDTKNFYQAVQNLRLILQSNSNLSTKILLQQRIPEDSSILAKLLETSEKVPVDHIRNECGRLLAVLATNCDLSNLAESSSSDPDFCQTLCQIATTISSMLKHSSYVMQNEAIVALNLILECPAFVESCPTGNIEKICENITESIVSVFLQNSGSPTSKDDGSALLKTASANAKSLNLILRLIDSFSKSNNSSFNIKEFFEVNLKNHPSFVKLSDHQMTASLVKSFLGIYDHPN